VHQLILTKSRIAEVCLAKICYSVSKHSVISLYDLKFLNNFGGLV